MESVDVAVARSSAVTSAAGTRASWDLTRILLGVVAIGGLIAATFWVLRPFLPALVWATMIVVATWPLLRRVERWLWGKRGFAVTVMTVAMLLIVMVPIGLGIMTIVEHSDAIVSWSRSLRELSIPGPPAWVRGLPVVGARIAEEWQTLASSRPEELAARAAPYLKAVVVWAVAQAGGLGALFLQLLLTVAISAILYAQGETVARGVLAFARRLGGAAGERVTILSGQAIRAVALGIVVTALVQSVIGGIGLAVTGVPYATVLTAVLFLLGIAQIGPLPVLIGAIVWLYWSDQTLWGTVLIVWSVVTASLDNILRPILIKQGADLPLLLIFAGVLGGLLAFGVIGLFIGPVVLAVTYTLCEAWVTDVEMRPEPARNDGGRSDAVA